VAEIRDFEFIVTDSEKEALLLEINLIKKHRPPFNIMFMDDKSYPYIEVTAGKDFAVRLSRRPTNKKSRYFGPYPNATSAAGMVKLINQIFPIRKCRQMGKSVCLYYHMHQCLAPCVSEVSQEQSDQMRTEIVRFLKGDAQTILSRLEAQRDDMAMDLKFERAQEIQQTIQSIEHVMEKQTIDFEDRTNRDVFGWFEDKGYVSFYGLFFREGKLLERTLSMTPIYDDVQDEFTAFILQYYQNNTQPKEILVPEGSQLDVLDDALEAKVRIPLRGEKKKLVELAQANARQTHEQKFGLAVRKDQELEGANAALSSIFKKPVHTVELYDNSHLQGTDNVAGMVVFKDGRPDKSQYRHFKLDGYRSDIDSMEEVLYRRLFRLLKEGKPMPDLILADGGAEQIKAVCKVRDALNLNILVAGLVKDDKHNTRALMNESLEEVPLDRHAPLFFLLTRMQDEVHRFAISYHHKLRSKGMTKSVLDDVPGIGPARKEALMKRFKSIKKMKEAPLDELAETVGSKAAAALWASLHPQD
jgi:excinuclease ABC subunit C